MMGIRFAKEEMDLRFSLRAKLREYRPLTAALLALSWPVMLENAMQTLVQYVDTAMVGALGAQASAAVGLTGSVTWLVNGIFFAAGVGALAVISRALGAKDGRTARETAGQSVLIALAAGAAMCVLTLLATPALPGWLNGEEEIRADAAAYFGIICTPMLFRAASIVFGSVLRAAGDTRTPMLANLAMNALNVVLNFLLIYATREMRLLGLTFTVPGAGLGVRGAAIATAISYVLGGVLIARAMWKNPAVSPRGGMMRPNGAAMRNCLRIAAPVALARLTTSAGHVVFAALVATLGTVSLAAHSIALTAEQAFYIPALGVNTAAATLTGNALGEKDARKLDMVGRSTIVVTLVLMTVTGGLLFAFAPQVMRIFTPDALVAAQGVSVLRLVALSEPIFGVAIGVEGMLQGAGDTAIPFVITTATMWLVRIAGTVLVLRLFHQGLNAVWTCMVAENTVRGALYLIRYLRGRWKPADLRPKAAA